jgi:hypothetical protein
MKTEIVEVSPSLADKWLENNTFNRSISRRQVLRYSSDMRRGKWVLNHQGIAFSDDGTLVDGQHRLAAIVDSGVTVTIMVTWGAEKTGIDELRVRSSHDVIRFGEMSEWISSKDIGATKQMAVMFSASMRTLLSTTELVEFAEMNKDALLFSRGLFTQNKRSISTALVRATIAVAYYHFDRDVLSRFVNALYSGIIQGEKESAVVRAREQLGELKGTGEKDRIAMAKRLCRSIIAFNAGQPLGRLQTPLEFPFLLPKEKS